MAALRLKKTGPVPSVAGGIARGNSSFLMHLFTCDSCGQRVYFESSRCTACHSPLGFFGEERVMSSLGQGAEGGGPRRALSANAPYEAVRYCENAKYGACNWLVPAEKPGLCGSCLLSEVVPDLSVEITRERWIRAEKAKRRLLFTLGVLGLPIESRRERKGGLTFRILKPSPQQYVATGHMDGIITFNLDESDHVFRENQREILGENYRTSLGHFRHESGHYYFNRLVQNSAQQDAFRDLFGDERADYQAALEKHYASGPKKGWPAGYISAYATMHPAEDWAETWAHYLHMVDTLDTAQNHAGAQLEDLVLFPESPAKSVRDPEGAVHTAEFDDLIKAWVPLTLLLNSLNRSLGLRDAYPFALSATIERKLRFVHDVIRRAASDAKADPGALSRTRVQARVESD